MPNIRVDISYTIADGSEVVFSAPCNCSEVTGLKVYHPDGAKEFTFKDAHGADLTGIGELFAAGAIVKAILDVTNGHAYIQNADTNAYLEGKFATKLPLPPTAQVGQFVKVAAVDATGRVTATEAVTVAIYAGETGDV